MKHYVKVLGPLLMALGFLTAYQGQNLALRKIEQERFLLECVASMEKAVPPAVAEAPPEGLYAAALNWCEGRLDPDKVDNP